MCPYKLNSTAHLSGCFFAKNFSFAVSYSGHIDIALRVRLCYTLITNIISCYEELQQCAQRTRKQKTACMSLSTVTCFYGHSSKSGISKRIFITYACHVPKSVHKMSYNVLENQRKRGLL